MTEPGIQEITIQDFQSLKHVKFKVGRFTAIVGQSNVGKSAVVRALKMLMQNGSSSGYVRKGAKGLSVSAEFEDGTHIAVRRGPRQSEYDYDLPGESKRTFAKCGTAVPPEIANLWRLSPVSLAGQHDAPFMLSEPGSAVAARLGDLTNVSIVAEAVRITNRQRLEASQDFKARTRELDELVKQLEAHGDLQARKQRLKACRAALGAAAALESQVQVLAKLIGDARAAVIALSEAQKQAQWHSDADGQLKQAEVAVSRWLLLRGFLELQARLGKELAEQERQAEHYGNASDHLDEERKKVLRELGFCPTCGQGVHQ